MTKQGIRDVEKANYLRRIDPSTATDISALFAGITKPVYNTHYVSGSTGNLYDGTAAGNTKMVTDVKTVRDGLVAVARKHLAGNPKPVSFSVSFDKNDGAGVYSSLTVTSPKVIAGELPAAPKRPGYIFTGWNTKKDASGMAFIASTTVTGDITVYAKWAPVTETSIELIKDGGKAKADYTIIGPNDGALSYMVILAVYDPQGKFLSLTTNSDSVNANGVKIESLESALPEGCSAKAFIWEASTFTPLAKEKSVR
jgi:uncharacterized repeat protein (TIGR02543 family)